MIETFKNSTNSKILLTTILLSSLIYGYSFTVSQTFLEPKYYLKDEIQITKPLLEYLASNAKEFSVVDATPEINEKILICLKPLSKLSKEEMASLSTDNILLNLRSQMPASAKSSGYMLELIKDLKDDVLEALLDGRSEIEQVEIKNALTANQNIKHKLSEDKVEGPPILIISVVIVAILIAICVAIFFVKRRL